MLDEIMGEPKVLNVINKINGKLKFLYRKDSYLIKELRTMLCNALVQPHFDMRVQPGTLISMKKEKENTNNATEMHSLLPKLRKIQHVTEKEFRLINW